MTTPQQSVVTAMRVVGYRPTAAEDTLISPEWFSPDPKIAYRVRPDGSLLVVTYPLRDEPEETIEEEEL